MRRALGLNGTLRPRPESDRGDQQPSPRLSDRFSPAHRRRFVQDGDVPVAYVRREQQVEQPVRQSAQSAPVAVRLERLEATLAAETAARQQAERGFQEMQATLHDLRTKLGHANLARDEAVEALRRERESRAASRQEAEDHAAKQQDAEDRIRVLQREVAALRDQLTEEQSERRALEKSLRVAEEAQETAERLLRVLSEEEPVQATVTTLTRHRPAAKATAKKARVEVETAPEPVKWWLHTSPVAKRR